MKVSDKLKSSIVVINNKSQNDLAAKDVLILELNQKYDSFLADFNELPFRMFPSYTHGEKWFSAWEIFGVSRGNNIVKAEVADLDYMVKAYLNNDQAGFDKRFASFSEGIKFKVEEPSVLSKINAELFYNVLDPFYHAQIILVIVLSCLLYLIWFGTNVCGRLPFGCLP